MELPSFYAQGRTAVDVLAGIPVPLQESSTGERGADGAG